MEKKNGNKKVAKLNHKTILMRVKKYLSKVDLSKNKFNTIEIVLIFIMALVFGVLIGQIFNLGTSNTSLKSYNSADTTEINKVYLTIVNEYIDKVDKNRLKQAAIEGMLSVLNDKHTNYLDEEDSKKFEDELNGYFYGIGAAVSQKDGDLVIVEEVYKNSPADKAGLKKGDKYLKINDEDVTKLTSSEISNKIKDTNGKDFTVTVKRDTQEKVLKLKIGKVEIPSVESKIIEKDSKKIGYIKISIFASNTDEQLKDHLKKLEKENLGDLIIDLRYNQGGQLDTVLNVASEFLDKGVPIMQISTKNETEVKYSRGNDNKKYNNIIVLVNAGTASASEVLSAALNENLGAKLIGDVTYGKGTVQKTKQLSDGSTIKYTIQTWKTAKGKSIDRVGIKPTIKIEQNKNYYKTLKDKDDVQLQRALTELVNRA